MRDLVLAMLSRPVAVNALGVALVVGTLLNAINQGPAVLDGGSIEWGKLLLNYAVPFLVSSYSAAKLRVPKRD